MVGWSRVALVTFGLSLLGAGTVHANGRFPGANDVAFHPALPNLIVARATFGVVHSRDNGQSFRWICEQAIDASGVISDPPISLTQDGSMVLLPPSEGALVSHDHGCSWQRAEGPLADARGVDLTLDPSDPARLLVLTSTLRSLDATGLGNYQNLVLETRDDGRSFQSLATLATDFEAETIEVARSDSQRIYVSGTHREDPRLGLLFRSEDGGSTWHRTALQLPPGTGSLLISAIHPNDPDKLWLRVAARGDTIGLLQARLFITRDKGETFEQLAATNRGMFGFALSPDGNQLVYGGPYDGLFLGPSDGGPYVKQSNLSVRCLRWPAQDALYACADQPTDMFSVGVSRDLGKSFTPLYKLADTCPAECDENSAFVNSCHAVWSQTREQLSAPATMCQAWAQPETTVLDAAVPDAEIPAEDAAIAVTMPDAAVDEPAEPAQRDPGCSCDTRGHSTSSLLGALGALGSLALLALRRRSRS